MLILAIPLVVSPYLTRTLQETALGTYAYVNSIAYYFVVLANLGISVHGRRIISVASDDKLALRKKFWSLFFVHILISLVSIFLYVLFLVFFVKEDSLIYWIQVIYVISAMFDVTWFFYGMENFSSVVKRNTLVKILECFLIFSFVRNSNDIYVYTFICSTSLFLGQIVMIPRIIRIVKPISFTLNDISEHLKPLLVFSVSLIATTLYTVFDKTLLGILDTKESVAFFEYSNKIIHIPLAFTGIVGTVMLPRVCKLVASGSLLEQKRYLDYSFMMIAFIGLGSFFGLYAISEKFIILYYGESFAECGRITVWLAPLIFIIGAGSVFRTQCMIPNHMDKAFNMCIVFNAFVNLALSVLLIPIYGVYGAVFGTVGAELFGLLVQSYLCNKFYKFKELIKDIIPFFINGLIMFCFLKYNLPYMENLSKLMLGVLAALAIYITLTLIYLYIAKNDIYINIIYSLKRGKF